MANADDGDAVVGHAAPAEKVARSAVPRPPEDGREGGRGARRAGWRQPSSQSARETHCGRVSQKARAERAPLLRENGEAEERKNLKMKRTG